MNGIVKIALATIVAALSFVSLSAQTKCCDKETNLRWGVTAGMNGFDAGKADLSHDRGRCGFNVAARMELLFRTTPSRPYMDVELGLLNLNWKKHYAHHISDFQTGEQTDYDQTFRRNAYYLHLPIHFGYRWAVAQRCAIYADAGPYFSFGLFGKARNTDNISHQKSKGSVYDEIKRFDFGIGARLGVEVADHYRIGIGYDYGLRKMDKVYSDHKNRNFTFSVGYMF